jgi:hypothetical protein
MTSFRQLSPLIDLLIVSVNGLYGFGIIQLYFTCKSARKSHTHCRPE